MRRSSSAEPTGPDYAREQLAEDSSFPCATDDEAEVGLALSGGGLRATLYHLGALARIRELGWLGRIDRISSVSGGSIMAAIVARAWPRLEADGFSSAAFERHVTRPTIKFASRRIDAFAIAAGLVPGVNPTDLVARWFERDLTHGMRLSDLPNRPRFIFNAAHLATGVSWRFSKPFMGDSRLGVVCEPQVPVARAVAASAAFPPFVAPHVLDLRGMELRRTEGAELFDSEDHAALKNRVLLLDGGVYDNLGIEPIEGRCRIALASDAGGNLRLDPRADRYRFWWPLLRRTLDMSVEVGRAQRRRALVDRATMVRRLPEADPVRRRSRTEHVALWRTSFEAAGNSLLPESVDVRQGWNTYLASRPTRLWPMHRRDRDALIDWGYLTADLMLRRWVPELEDAEPPTRLPMGSNLAAAPPA